MPLYVYKCKNCEYEFEVFQTFEASPIQRCPQCEGKVKKIIFSTPFVFGQPTGSGRGTEPSIEGVRHVEYPEEWNTNRREI